MSNEKKVKATEEIKEILDRTELTDDELGKVSGGNMGNIKDIDPYGDKSSQ